ncbi:hypothetical protein ACFCWG_41825 [Streptomyces sp. NPDC056390]|uniref:hypothetical protein n=1 Tax=Streptomyces sp. NPDC056390 TaxID=3345806 RepID=UPI0035DD4BB0
MLAVQTFNAPEGKQDSDGRGQKKPADTSVPQLKARVEPQASLAGWIVPETRRAAVAEQPVRGSERYAVWVDRMRAWERRTGAVRAAPQGIRLALRGVGSKPITINKVEVEHKKCRPAVKGIHVVFLSSHTAEKTFLVDLDEVDLAATYENVQANSDFPVKLRKGELEDVEISAVSANQDCDWVAKVTWVSNGHTRVSTIDDQGKPFRTTGLSRRTATLPIAFTGGYVPQTIPDSIKVPPSGKYVSNVDSDYLIRGACIPVSTPARGFGWITGTVCQHEDGLTTWQGATHSDADDACAKIFVVWMDTNHRVIGSHASKPHCLPRNAESAPSRFIAPSGAQMALSYLIRAE